MSWIGIDASRADLSIRTGTENYSRQVIDHLLRLNSRHRITLYFNSSEPPREFADRAECRCMPSPRFWTHGRLSLEMLNNPPDLLFVPSHVLPLIHPQRTAVTIHDVGYLYVPGAYSWIDWWYLRLSTLWNLRRAKVVIVDSHATAGDVGRVSGRTASTPRTVHLGVEPRFSPAARSESERVRSRLGLPERYFLYVGTIQMRKNLINLLNGYKLALAEDPALPALVLAGADGYRASEIRSRAQSLDLGPKVKFIGYTPDVLMPGLIAGAVGLVLVSWYEGFGLPALEAMACGTPVVASNTTSLPEVVGDAGLLVPPHDTAAIGRSLIQLTSDPNLREELADRGLRRAGRFTWRRCAEETLAALEDALVC